MHTKPEDPLPRVARLMAELARGDAAAVIPLAHEFGGPITAVLRRHLARMGVTGVPRDELEGLLYDSCFELRDCAGAWDPQGGALPWVWADRRLAALCSRHIGQHTDVLEPERHLALVAEPGPTGGSSADEPDPLAVLELVAEHDHRAALLLAAFAEVGSLRDHRLLLDYAVQQDAGDPSPAVTLAREYGLQAPAVRQAVKRLRANLRALAERDERFAPLADLSLVA